MKTALVPARPSTELYLPALIAGAGKPAARRFLEFFAVNIRNRNTRAAYARVARVFLNWCEEKHRGAIRELRDIQPVHAQLRTTSLCPSHMLNLTCYVRAKVCGSPRYWLTDDGWACERCVPPTSDGVNSNRPRTDPKSRDEVTFLRRRYDHLHILGGKATGLKPTRHSFRPQQRVELMREGRVVARQPA